MWYSSTNNKDLPLSTTVILSWLDECDYDNADDIELSLSLKLTTVIISWLDECDYDNTNNGDLLLSLTTAIYD